MKTRFVVIWDPPINKGTVGCIFDTHDEAWGFVRDHLEPSGWPMNIRVIHGEEGRDFYDHLKQSQGETA